MISGKIKLSPVVRQCMIVATLNLSVYTSGCGFGWSSPVLVKLIDTENPVLSEPISVEQVSWIVSASFVSGILATLVAPPLLDRTGRKYFLILSGIPKLLCYLIMILAKKAWMLIFARALLGIADCFTFMVVPIFATEIASVNVRGRLGSSGQIFSALGSVTMLVFGPFIEFLYINTFLFCACVATTIATCFIPESPYALHKKGKKHEAVKVLLLIRSSKTKVHKEMKEYGMNSKDVKQDKMCDILKSKTAMKSLGIVVCLTLAYQLSGVNILKVYLQSIFLLTKSSVPSELASIIIGCIDLTGSILTMFLTDKFGRKPLIISTSIGSAIGMIGLGTFFEMTKSGVTIDGFLNYLPLASIILSIFSFSVGITSLIWPLLAELLEGPIRGIGMNIGMATAFTGVFVSTQLFGYITTLAGPAMMFWLCSCFAVITCLFVLFCVPETKGKSFADIQIALGKEVESGGIEDIQI